MATRTRSAFAVHARAMASTVESGETETLGPGKLQILTLLLKRTTAPTAESLIALTFFSLDCTQSQRLMSHLPSQGPLVMRGRVAVCN